MWFSNRESAFWIWKNWINLLIQMLLYEYIVCDENGTKISSKIDVYIQGSKSQIKILDFNILMAKQRKMFINYYVGWGLGGEMTATKEDWFIFMIELKHQKYE